MDDEEARALLRDHLEGYRRRAYGDLVALLGKPQVAELRGASGVTYQIEVEVHWDDRPGPSGFLAPSTTADGARSSLSARTSFWRRKGKDRCFSFAQTVSAVIAIFRLNQPRL